MNGAEETINLLTLDNREIVIGRNMQKIYEHLVGNEMAISCCQN